MKLIHITFRFQYSEDIDKMLDAHGVADYARYPMVHGKDIDGKHFGSKIFPGNFTVVQAIVQDDTANALMKDLDRFRKGKRARYHLRAAVMPIEGAVGYDE